jgi:type VI secretion system protein ImpH
MERKPQPADPRLNVAALLEALRGRVAEASVYRFCQLLEEAAPGRPPLGSSERPADDLVRFRPDPGMGFPASELKGLEWPSQNSALPATVRTRVLGLYGVDSPLPPRYLDDIAQRREGHEALEAFLDVFNHRIFTQYYRIWRKYSYPASFASGGVDATSQCLFGLIGLGIPGTAKRVDTPLSRFLALLGIMRLPTRNAEGITALVRVLAARTQATTAPHWPLNITLAAPASLSAARPVSLSQGTPLGRVGWDVNSELLLTLFTADHDEARNWLPGGTLRRDLLVLFQVYLGWRCTVRLRLSLPIACLPPSVLSGAGVLLGMTASLALQCRSTGQATPVHRHKPGSEIDLAADSAPKTSPGPIPGPDPDPDPDLSRALSPKTVTIYLGRYKGLKPKTLEGRPLYVAFHI